SAAVVFGETIRMSQLPLDTKALMSEICLSSLPCASATLNEAMSALSWATSAFMVVQPTTRQGLPTSALEKQSLYGPGFLYFDVSAIVPPMCCSQSLSAGPSAL